MLKEEMSYRSALLDLIEQNGGTDESNLRRISQELKTHEETFTARRLKNLLTLGLRPTQEERRAVSLVLEPQSERWISENWLLEDIASRKVVKIALDCTKSHVMVKEIVDHVHGEVSFRNEDLSGSDLNDLCKQFLEDREKEDEIELFGLKV